MSDAKRNELILISDVLGIESLVDSMAHERAAAAAAAPVTDGAPAESAPTLSAILGPFYRENAPKYPNGSDVVLDHSITDTNGKPGITASIRRVHIEARQAAPALTAAPQRHCVGCQRQAHCWRRDRRLGAHAVEIA
jgi:catechol 1,2-dioxygenase